MSLKPEIPDYSHIKDLVQRGEKVAALDLVLKLREAAVDLREDLQEASDRIRELEEQAQLRAKISFKNNVCWIEGDAQPICPLCWEDANKGVHLDGPYPQDDG